MTPEPHPPAPPDPFAPADSHRGTLGELRNLEYPADTSDFAFEPVMFSTSDKNCREATDDLIRQFPGCESRFIPGVAVREHGSAEYELHRLH